MTKTRCRKATFLSRSLAPVIEALENRYLLCTPGGPFPTPLPYNPPPVHRAQGQKHQLDSIPQLSSHPSATWTAYLDFVGDPQFVDSNYSVPAYDEDGDPSTFSDSELESIARIWEGVAEKFSPFDINVT